MVQWVVRTLSLYSLLSICVGGGIWYGANQVATTGAVEWVYSESETVILSVTRCSYFLNILYEGWSFIGLLIFMARKPATIPSPVPSLPQGVKVVLRIVTRGQNGALVKRNVEHILGQLARLKRTDDHIVEVVTDHLHPELTDLQHLIHEIVVPENYQPACDGELTRFKARALQYAIENSTAQDDDWIVHLDEETRFDDAFLLHLPEFINKHQQGHMIAQGAIRYIPEFFEGFQHFLCTLADSLRVTDDLARFQLQLRMGKCWFGIKGSFLVIPNRTEKLIGFNHGNDGSMTEDTFFAMKASELKVPFAFLEGSMFEKSPFSLLDFLKQRRRWFAGLRLVVFSKKISGWYLIGLGLSLLAWALAPLMWISFLVFLAVPFRMSAAVESSLGALFGIFIMLYIHGFIMSVTPETTQSRLKLVGMFICQLLFIPVICVLESAAVAYALCCPPDGFHVVKKNTTITTVSPLADAPPPLPVSV
jgi:egghead protein (zeste-white 4 protein)